MVNSFLEKLLKYYNLTYEDIIKENEDDLSSLPKKEIFKYGNQIASYLKEAILSKKKILIYGDYDCDGIMSTSILYLTLKTDDYTPGYYIPSREYDGYGLTPKNVKKFHELGYNIIVCVDNGVKTHEAIDLANSLGMEVVIFDHHKVTEELPKAKFIMHPEVDNFGEYNISAGEVTFYFSLFYLGKINYYLLSLCALSILSDAMPLLSYNRTLVKEAIKIINEKRYEQIFVLLKGNEQEINEDDLSMTVIPKINAICRLLNDDTRFSIVKYFVTSDLKVLNRLSLWINQVNEKRRFLVNNLNLSLIENSNNCVFYENKENEGIGGLIANKLLNSYAKPSFVFSKNEVDSSILKGSARSLGNYDISSILEKNANLLEAYGGHKNAGGFTIKKSNLKDFKESIVESTKDLKIEIDEDFIEISTEDLTLKNYEIYHQFAPFGEGRKKPKIKISGLNVNEIKNFVYNKHILYRFNHEASICIFNFDPKILEGSFVDVYGYLNLNIFKGIKTVQLIVNDFEIVY